MIQDHTQYSLNKDRQLRKCQQVMDIMSRLQGCAGQSADAVSAYNQVKMEDAPSSLKVPKSECPDIWIRLPKHKWPKSWSQLFLSNEICTSFGRTIVGTAIRESFIGTRLGKSSKLGMFIR